MSPYRDNVRPKVLVGDRVRVSLTLWERLRHRSGISSWHGHDATVRNLFVYKECSVRSEGFCEPMGAFTLCGAGGMSCRFGGLPGAGLDLDVGCGITMPLRFLVRSSTQEG